jgi:serine/threonine protein phosphatase PrpC
MPPAIAFADYLFGAASNTGRKRSVNQDAFAILLPAEGSPLPPLLVVADGMGGHLGGETASQLVIEAFQGIYATLEPGLDPAAALKACAEAAHRAIHERAAGDPDLKGMGSTVTAAFLLADRVHALNVGDSRIYLLRGQEIRQVSVDQSWVMDQVRAGRLTLEQARRHRKRNHLSMSLSANRPSIIPILKEETFERDDILLLCSDGLWGVIPESLIWAAANEFEPQDAAEKLVALANLSGGPDNISVIIGRRKDRQPVKTMDDDVTNPGE